jgi:hypothetical protein
MFSDRTETREGNQGDLENWNSGVGKDLVTARRRANNNRDVAVHLDNGPIQSAASVRPDPRVHTSDAREKFLGRLASKHDQPTAFKPSTRHRPLPYNPPKHSVSNLELHGNDRGEYSAAQVRKFQNQYKTVSDSIRSRVRQGTIFRDSRTQDNGVQIDTTSSGVHVVVPQSRAQQIAQDVEHDVGRQQLARESAALLATHKWHDWGAQAGRAPNVRYQAVQTARSDAPQSDNIRKRQNLQSNREVHSRNATGSSMGYSHPYQPPENIYVRTGKNRTFATRYETSRTPYSIDQRGANIENFLPKRTRGGEEILNRRTEYSQTNDVYQDPADSERRDTVKAELAYDGEHAGRLTMGNVRLNRVAYQNDGLSPSFVPNRTKKDRSFTQPDLLRVGVKGTRQLSQRRFNSTFFDNSTMLVDRKPYQRQPLRLDEPQTRFAEFLKDDQPM